MQWILLAAENPKGDNLANTMAIEYAIISCNTGNNKLSSNTVRKFVDNAINKDPSNLYLRDKYIQSKNCNKN